MASCWVNVRSYWVCREKCFIADQGLIVGALSLPQFRLIYHVNDAQRLLTILSVASMDDVYKELRTRLP